jgi:hypothetical protein
LVTEDQETGEIAEAVFAPYDGKTAGARMQKFLQDNPQLTVIEKEKRVYPEPESHALEAVRTQLYSIEKECRDHFGCEFTDITTVLSGPGNYRERIATVVPYKGNRDPSHKPYWYQSIRNFLTRDYGAKVIHGREADDECSIIGHRALAAGIPFVVATIDKDLDQIPGNHYNYLKQVFYAQSSGDALAFFLQQCLSGDATDGIPGCFRVGEQRAAASIQRWLAGHAESERALLGTATAADRIHAFQRMRSIGRGAPRARLGCPADVWENIVAEYRASQARPGCPYVESSPEAVALETARLVYLQQEEGELWIPTGPPHDLLPEYKDG